MFQQFCIQMISTRPKALCISARTSASSTNCHPADRIHRRAIKMVAEISSYFHRWLLFDHSLVQRRAVSIGKQNWGSTSSCPYRQGGLAQANNFCRPKPCQNAHARLQRPAFKALICSPTSTDRWSQSDSDGALRFAERPPHPQPSSEI